jgi:putative transposase
MPRFPRLVVPGYPHHVTQRGVRRQATFFDDIDYRSYLRLAVELKKDWSVEFWAYCLMPNHIHAVVVPKDDDCLSKFFAILHRRYAWRTNRRHDWLGHLWQKRFYSVVMDEPHAVAALRYVEQNPVRAGLCESAEEWPWSSARGNLGLFDDPLIEREATKALVPDWRKCLSARSGLAIKEIRQQTCTGRPAGSAQFMDQIERRSGRCVRKRRAGRRPK